MRRGKRARAPAPSALQTEVLAADCSRSLQPEALTSVHAVTAEGSPLGFATLASVAQAVPGAVDAGLFSSDPIGILIGIAGGIVILWLALVCVLWRVRRRFDLDTLGGGARILPDLLRLLKRLATDKSLPRGVRTRVWLLVAFVISPIDLIPDFIPVIGYLDDAVLVAIVLRSIVRRSGRQAIERHWPGTPDGLAAVLRLAGIREPSDTQHDEPDPPAA